MRADPAEILSPARPHACRGALQRARMPTWWCSIFGPDRPGGVLGDEPPAEACATCWSVAAVITDGVLDLAARPGQPVRRPSPTAGDAHARPSCCVRVPGGGQDLGGEPLLAHAEGRRIAAVVNDFGAINIDAELIAGASGAW